MPHGIADLPRDPRGYPIPFVAGGRDFRIIDQGQWNRIVQGRLCGMCGQPLEYWIALIGDVNNIEGRMFIDPAMHPACARYSLAVCPFLAREHTRLSTRPVPDDGSHYIQPPLKDRPAKMGLYITRSFTVVRTPLGSPYRLMVRPAPARSVEWF